MGYLKLSPVARVKSRFSWVEVRSVKSLITLAVGSLCKQNEPTVAH